MKRFRHGGYNPESGAGIQQRSVCSYIIQLELRWDLWRIKVLLSYIDFCGKEKKIKGKLNRKRAMERRIFCISLDKHDMKSALHSSTTL